MHASRAHEPRTLSTRRPRRLAAGLAAAAVVTAGLACATVSASAAELADFPQDLGFTPTGLAATATDAYAIGYVGVDTDDQWPFEEVDGYVEEVGSGTRLHLGDGSWPTAVSASPDGETLHVIGTEVDEQSPENGPSSHRWTVRTSDMTITDEADLGFDNYFDVVAGAEGTYSSYTGMTGAAVWRSGTAPVLLGHSVQPTHLGLLPGDGGEDVVVVGSDWLDEGGSVAALRTIADGVASGRTVLGAPGQPDSWVTGMDVDEENGLVYVVSGRDPVDGPQEYGLNVIGEGVHDYVPLPDPVFTVAVSADGETVFLPGYGVAAYDADALDSYTEDEPAPSAYLGGSSSIEHVAVDPAGRLYVVQDHDVETDEGTTTATRVHALEAPGAPTALTAAASEWDSSTLVVTWAEPTSLGGTGADSVTYTVTLQDDAGGEPVVDHTFLTDTELSGLVPGHDYTVSVTTSNGAFTSAAATTTFTAPEATASPESVAVRGKLAVGSRLSVATTGTWAEGAELTYRWTNDLGKVLSYDATAVLGSGQLGRRVRVEVTGTVEGLAPTTVTSVLSTKVAYGTLSSRTPVIKGTAKVGRTLSASVGTWTSGTRFAYRWTANGKTIRGATGRSYRPTRAVVGKQIRVVVAGKKAGYRTVTKTSRPTARVKR